MSSCDSCCATLQMPFGADMLNWLSESLAEPEACMKDMTAINATTPNGVHHDLVAAVSSSAANTSGATIANTNTSSTNGPSSNTTSTSLRLPIMQPCSMSNTTTGTCHSTTNNSNCSMATGSGSGSTGHHHTHAHAVFMYSTAADGNVTLQLRDTCSGDDCTDIVARGEQCAATVNGVVGDGSGDLTGASNTGITTLSISYQDIATDLLGDANSIDVLLGTAPCGTNGVSSTVCTATLHAASAVTDDAAGTTTVLDLFDSSSGGHDLTLSPQTFTSSTEAFINDNSDSLGVPPDTDNVCGTEEARKTVGVTTSEVTKLTVKRARPKAASPNRQGPQQCQVCSKVFGNASALAKHKLTHSDERKYVCSMCGKAFKRQDHLNGHMLTHRNKKPYECKAEGCGKSYCDARSLRRHTENHHSSLAASVTPAGAAALISGNASVSTSTLSPAQGAASGDAASPHGAASSTCIQYAPPPTSGNGVGSTNEMGRNSDNIKAGTKSSGNHGTAGGNGTTTNSLKSGKSQLQQLLASEPTNKIGNSTQNNEGLTKQQLDLIHQIMEQTQRQSQHITSTAVKNTTAKSTNHSKPKLSRTWSAPAQSNTVKSSTTSTNNSTVTTTTNAGTGQQSNTTNNVQVVPKPVECNLCHRKFKNIPALNGHMRLHGGYFKKDAENKKTEKKESVGPPLQTASVSVRALIEEKIINKRSINPQNVTITNANVSNSSSNIANNCDSSTMRTNTPRAHLTTSAPPLFPLTNNTSNNENIKLTSFVVPAPPVTSTQTQTVNLDKNRRHSDIEKFTIPRAPNITTNNNNLAAQQEADALADLILKRSTKVMKRTASDPGHINVQQQIPSPQQQLQLQFEQAGEAFSLAGVTFQQEDSTNEYFSSSLQEEDVFHQVQETMLLQGVDAAQLAESIQLQTSTLLQGQTTEEHLQDIASLEEYANVTARLQESGQNQSNSTVVVNQELQAVLDSPLPESLAEFSTYHSTAGINSPKDVLTNYTSNQSPMQQYSSSPHAVTLATQSPLQSPLIRHDSPGFAYPTPPASHEGQSPGFANTHLLPLLSPQNSDNFNQSITNHGNRDIDEPPQASSPLSAAFYTSTMSSSAAVEEALEEVLPGETIPPDDVYTTLTNSPPSQNSVSVNVNTNQSPMSTNLPNTSSIVTTTVSGATQVAFSMSPQYTLQSQMMPNSDDPLLSSNPKDCFTTTPTKKRIEFGGFQSFKIVSSNGLVDLANPALTGILVDSNGELKFIQTSAPFTKNIVVTSTGNLSAVTSQAQGPTTVQIIQPAQTQIIAAPKREEAKFIITEQQNNFIAQTQNIAAKINRLNNRGTQYTIPAKVSVSPKPKLHIAVDNLKQEEPDDVFLSPTTIPASPIRASRKRPRSEPPLVVPIVHQSRLRASRGRPPGAAPYTPAPILNPSRQGPGLYAHAKWKASISNSLNSQNNSRINNNLLNRNSTKSPLENKLSSQLFTDSIPESDSTPHINVGPQYQCAVPTLASMRNKLGKDNREPSYEHLLWDPGIKNICTETEINMYMELACCAAVPGGGQNKEYALHLLHLCGGNVQEAMLKLMHPSPALPNDHNLLSYCYSDCDSWSQIEIEAFHRALLKYNKDFFQVAKEVSTKNTKQCVQFYYLWKKVCSDEYKRIRTNNRSHRDTPPIGDHLQSPSNISLLMDCENPLIQTGVLTQQQPEVPSRTFSCEYADCSASFNSRAALNGHIRIHGGTVRRSPTPNPNFNLTAQAVTTASTHQQINLIGTNNLILDNRRLTTAIAHHNHHFSIASSVAPSSSAITTASSISSGVLNTTCSIHNNNTGMVNTVETTNKLSTGTNTGIDHLHNNHHHHNHQNHLEEFPCKVCGK